MTFEALLSLFVLALAASTTPGPNNVMLASSGANFGFRKTFPHMAGIVLGFPLMILGVGFFLGQLFEASPVLRDVLRWLGIAMLLWMAWKIGTSGGISASDGRARPLRIYEAAAFQWVNPKGWAMVLALTAQFVTGDNTSVVVPIIAMVFAVTGSISTTLWAGFGTAMGQWLNSPVRLIWFNRSMAVLIVASIAVLFVAQPHG